MEEDEVVEIDQNFQPIWQRLRECIDRELYLFWVPS
jgi:hypothetical protein